MSRQLLITGTAVAALCGGSFVGLFPAASAASPPVPERVSGFATAHCLDCHSSADPEADLDLQSALERPLASETVVWERVIRKLRARQMPPPDLPRPSETEFHDAITSLAQPLDQLAEQEPRPGRTATFRRLTRFEYESVIRDLLALEIDAADMLPLDSSSHGFDNVTAGELSPTLLNRYLTAATTISRMAVGGVPEQPLEATFRVPGDRTQEAHVPGLPLGTRGGLLVSHSVPADGSYRIRVRLTRDRNEGVEGLTRAHELVVLVDRQEMARYEVRPPQNRDHSQIDAHLAATTSLTAGPHSIGVTFVRRSAPLQEIDRQPWDAHFNRHRHPRQTPAVFQVSVSGPLSGATKGRTPSRERLQLARLANAADPETVAGEILAELLRRAWRRPVTEQDLARPMRFYRKGAATGDPEQGMELALRSVLVSPEFLFRIERDPRDATPGSVYRISDQELASRLSFFLWSSLPDDTLLTLAELEQLREPRVLTEQVRRMLADDRAQALVTSFAGQWLYLRNLDGIRPDMRRFPDFDDNLRNAMRRETELLFADVLTNDRSVLTLLRPDVVRVNERLARHYGIPHVYGSRFREVSTDAAPHRGGILRHGSLLTVTSYATRTSPVIRGHWILKNLLGTPPPPPPDDVPALSDNTVSAALPVRARLEAHRANAACAGCHRLMDPVGFSLENFDAIGRWRTLDAGVPVDASGGLPDGSEFAGVQGLEDAFLQHPEPFVFTLTEKLLTYALGRGVEHSDAPAVRRIVRDAADDNYLLSSLIDGIVHSVPFQMRSAE